MTQSHIATQSHRATRNHRHFPSEIFHLQNIKMAKSENSETLITATKYDPGRKIYLPWSSPENERFIPNSFFIELIATFMLIFLAQTQHYDEGIMFYAGSTGITVYLLIVITHVEAICHFNPAITTGIYFAGKLPITYMIMYLVAQTIGALSASALVYCLQKVSLEAGEIPAQTDLPTAADLSYNEVVEKYALDFHSESSSWVAVLIAEIFNSTHMCLITLVVLYNKKTFNIKTGALACGLSVMIGILSGFTFGGGCLNPLRSNAPWFYAKFFTNWVFTVGPITGSLIAAGLYRLFFDENRNIGRISYDRF